MRSRFLKTLALVLTVILLMTSMTGCASLDYREAVQLYNARRYAEAAELFAAAGDYEDAPQLLTWCNYWMATELMDAGSYAEALPRFQKLGSFEDSAQRVIECKYQMAILAFTEANYTDAESYFLEVADYRLAPEYLRQLNWQKFYDYIAGSGEESDGCFVISREADERTVSFLVDTAVPDTIQMIAKWTKDMGYLFSDELQLSLKRDTVIADFTAISIFTMDFRDGQIGTEQVGTGTVALDAYSSGAELALDNFSLSGTDNLGNTLSSRDIADSTMNEAMVKNMAAILEALPQLLTEAGAEPIF